MGVIPTLFGPFRWTYIHLFLQSTRYCGVWAKWIISFCPLNKLLNNYRKVSQEKKCYSTETKFWGPLLQFNHLILLDGSSLLSWRSSVQQFWKLISQHWSCTHSLSILNTYLLSRWNDTSYLCRQNEPKSKTHYPLPNPKRLRLSTYSFFVICSKLASLSPRIGAAGMSCHTVTV